MATRSDESPAKDSVQSLRSWRDSYTLKKANALRELYKSGSSSSLQPTSKIDMADHYGSTERSEINLGENLSGDIVVLSLESCCGQPGSVSHHSISTAQVQSTAENFAVFPAFPGFLQPIQVAVVRICRNPWPTAVGRVSGSAYPARRDFV
ncbi:hypothetical protein BDN70DRAFT_926953 [Pholiota conissans]|uniref:Uncharacterized protein n=1 Tax=Pholiota conissans TaxID=109636 RepID=A0A9P6D750_9AGAR|nr:hypothetical protein BDN70DRAFT_926953 [Pholiota conissans]